MIELFLLIPSAETINILYFYFVLKLNINNIFTTKMILLTMFEELNF